MADNYFYGTGRRKCAVARVFMRPGNGNFVVNGKPVDEFFSRVTGRMIVRQPLQLVDQAAGFDIMVNVAGGGEFDDFVVGDVQEVHRSASGSW